MRLKQKKISIANWRKRSTKNRDNFYFSGEKKWTKYPLFINAMFAIGTTFPVDGTPKEVKQSQSEKKDTHCLHEDLRLKSLGSILKANLFLWFSNNFFFDKIKTLRKFKL
jgi:hypothetical protein